MTYPEKNITSFDEITEADVTYKLPDGRWIRVETDNLGDGPCFTLHRKMYRHQIYDFQCQGNEVRFWKTLNGAIRFIKKNFTL